MFSNACQANLQLGMAPCTCLLFTACLLQAKLACDSSPCDSGEGLRGQHACDSSPAVTQGKAHPTNNS